MADIIVAIVLLLILYIPMGAGFYLFFREEKDWTPRGAMLVATVWPVTFIIGTLYLIYKAVRYNEGA